MEPAVPVARKALSLVNYCDCGLLTKSGDCHNVTVRKSASAWATTLALDRAEAAVGFDFDGSG
jgi:hypothetical protein